MSDQSFTVAGVCSGVGGFDAAFQNAGFRVLWTCEVDENCQSVLSHRFPGVRHYDDMLGDDLLAAEKPTVFVGGTPCFPAGVLVLTQEGLKDISSVQTGDMVLTHQNRWREVTKVISHRSDTVLVKGQGVSGIETTANHPFWARTITRDWISGSKKSGGPCWRKVPHSPEWIRADALVDKFWSMPASVPPMDGWSFSSITPEFAWILGAWIGDGWSRSTKKQAYLCLCSDKREAEFLESKIKEAGFRYWRSEERTTTRFCFGDRALQVWVNRHFGKNCDGKRIPAWLMAAEKPIREAFYSGYLFADGHTGPQAKSDKPRDRFASINKGLAIGIRIIANSLGKGASICRYAHKTGEAVIEGRRCKVQPIFETSVFESSRSAVLADGMWWGNVRSVQPCRTDCTVFNLEVEEDHSYTADGLFVHNCQGFSVAGLRKGLTDDRSNLALRFIQLVNHLNPEVVVWENVPGILSMSDNAFGCFLAGLVGADAPLVPPKECGGRWTDSGLVAGPKRTAAWRILDSQYFHLAQRRERVFVVASPRAELPFQVLLEPEGMRRNSPPRRETRERVAPTLEGRAGRSGCNEFATSGGLAEVAGTLGGSSQSGGFRTTDLDGTGAFIPVADPDIVGSLCADSHPGSYSGQDAYSGRLVAAVDTIPIHQPDASDRDSNRDGAGVGDPGDPMFTLRDRARDAVAQPIPILEPNARTGVSTNDPRAGMGIGEPGDPMFTLSGKQHGVAFGITDDETSMEECLPTMPTPSQSGGGHPPAVAFEYKKDGADSGDITPTLRATEHKDSHANGGGHVAVAFNARQDPDSWSERTGPLDTDGSTQAVAHPVIAFDPSQSSNPKATHQATVEQSQPLIASRPPAVAFKPDQGAKARSLGESVETSPTLDTTNNAAIAFQQNQLGEVRAGDVAGTIGTNSNPSGRNTPMAMTGYAVRRLTPTECETLQGFPRNWTLVLNPRGKPMADGPRYKMMGNAVSVPVVEWIARRIHKFLTDPKTNP